MPRDRQTYLFGPPPPGTDAPPPPRWWTVEVPALAPDDEGLLALEDVVLALAARTLRQSAALEELDDEALTPDLVARWTDSSGRIVEVARGVVGRRYGPTDVPDICRVLRRHAEAQDLARAAVLGALTEDRLARVVAHAQKNRVHPLQARGELVLAAFLEAEECGDVVEILVGAARVFEE